MFEEMSVHSFIRFQNLTNISSVVENNDSSSLFERAERLPANHQNYGIILFETIIYVTLETIGNFLLFCMIMYEKFGMDPKKRTINNQLLSSICAVNIVYNLIVPTIRYINRAIVLISK